jgi:Tfp pilus assembly protein PilX
MIPSRVRANRRRRGVALVMTLGAIAVIGALVAGVLLSSLLERRAAMDEMLRSRALDAAELGLASTVAPAAWNDAWSTTAARGTITLRAFALDAPDAVDTVRVTKLSAHALLVVSDARVGLSALAFARRRVSTIVVLDSALRPVAARAHAWLELTR